ncbi:MAG TPA: choice-of-anchor tandem repeat NxxGxxAF-containing protein, partial [Planctomycetota bacterium]|nr:choice-of-anchor tandem repeat NxxGxxAF-containing protein [Planctomycetota bacterium]
DDPQGVAVDAAGNLFVADAGSGRVLMFPAGGGPGVQVGDVLDGPSALAFDAAGVLHVCTTGDDQVWKLVGPDFVPLASLAAGATPRSLAFGPSGDLYTANEGDDTIGEVTPAGGVSVFSDDVSAPWGLAFDATGKLHASDSQQGGRIVSFNPAGKAHAEVTGLGSTRSLGFDKAGDAYFLTAAGSLRRVVGTDSVEVASGLSGPAGLTVRAPELRVVAFKEQAPGDPADATFASLGSPAVGGGFVAFKGKLQPGHAGVIATNAWGVWRADPEGELSLLARQAFPAPGVADGIFASFGDPVLNADGGAAFLGKLASGPGGVTGADAKGVWADVDGTLTLIARQGDDAPGLANGVRFASFLQLVLPDDAGPAVLAKLKGPGVSGANDVGLWSADETGALALVVREGDEVVVGSGSLKLATLDLFETTTLSRGQSRHVSSQRSFTFLAHFTSGARAVVMVQPGQAPEVLLAPDDAVGPALDPGSFASFGAPCVSASATQFGFLAKLAPGVGDIIKPSSKAVFRQATELELEARTTFGAPGTDGAVFSWLSDPVVNAANTLALMGKLQPGLGDAAPGQNVGLWVDAGEGLQLVARQSDEAPGVKGAAFFKAFKQFVLPDAGGVVFAARLGGASIHAGNNDGVWASDGVGAIELLLRTGDTLDVDGATKTVASFKVFEAAAGVTGQSRAFDHAGSVVLLAKCTDGTKAIVRCVPVP